MTNPFVEEFRRGDVPRDMRLHAAQGWFLLKSNDDLLELLRILTADPDEEVRAAANKSLSSFPRVSQDQIEHQIELGAFESARRDAEHDSLVELIANNLANSEECLGFQKGVRAALVASKRWDREEIDALFNEAASRELGLELELDLVLLYRLNTSEKVITALWGTRQERAILIHDPDTLVLSAVLSSPRITKVELKSFIADRSLPESVRHQARRLLNGANEPEA